jgi:pimeloyl-ACP methyl ester carboxylesterase
MPVITRGGAAIRYQDEGHGSPPLVLVHGLGRREHFAAQVERFAPARRVVAPDLPGFGDSDAPEREYSIAAFAEDIAWLCTVLGLDRAVVAGHSMGGAVAVEVAARRPELVSGIVLIDPIPIVPAPPFHRALGGLVDALAQPGGEGAIRRYAEERMFRPTDDAALRARILDDLSAVPLSVAASALSSALRWDGERAVRGLDVPVLLITAGDGVPSDLPRIREVVPHLELGRTVGSGHFAHLMVPDQVNAMIDRFLAVGCADRDAA